MSVIHTDHAKKRVKQRLGKSTDRIAEIALVKGIKHCETTGHLRKFLDGIYLKHKKSNNSRIYGRMVYLFHNNILLTTIELPRNFHSVVDKIVSKKVKNVG